MIVIDEQLNDPRIIRAIQKWYKGRVTTIRDHRPGTLVMDDEIASILHHLNASTFVTINHSDFWRIIPAHRSYCVVCLKLPVERKLEVPNLLRELFRLTEFSTKKKRMGRVISVTDGRVSFYD